MLFDVSLVYKLDSSTLMCIIFQALIQLEQTSPESISGQCLGWVVEPLDFLDLWQNLATWMAWAGSLDAILSLKHIRFSRRFNPFDPVWMYFLRSHLVLSPWLAKQKKTMEIECLFMSRDLFVEVGMDCCTKRCSQYSGAQVWYEFVQRCAMNCLQSQLLTLLA